MWTPLHRRSTSKSTCSTRCGHLVRSHRRRTCVTSTSESRCGGRRSVGADVYYAYARSNARLYPFAGIFAVAVRASPPPSSYGTIANASASAPLATAAETPTGASPTGGSASIPGDGSPFVLGGAAAVVVAAAAGVGGPDAPRAGVAAAESVLSGVLPTTRLETDLMDKIARKKYVDVDCRRRRTPPPQSDRRRRGGGDGGSGGGEVEDCGESGTVKAASARRERPRGVPSRTRILTIDIGGEEMRSAFERDVVCRPSHSGSGNRFPATPSDAAVFRNGIAPPKVAGSTMDVAQKSFARELLHCRASATTKVGIEVLEASVKDLNPNDVRRRRGRSWGERQRRQKQQREAKGAEEDLGVNIASDRGPKDERGEGEGESSPADVDEADCGDGIKEAGETNGEGDVDGDDDENAPWNQYAWWEEMHLRINGLVQFGAPMERAPLLSRWTRGRTYSPTVPSSLGWWRWALLPFLARGAGGGVLGGSGGASDGIDGEGETDTEAENGCADAVETRNRTGRLNRASNKPHAVVADSEAMRRVPGSLRVLSECCRNADVPLFIVNDSRRWKRRGWYDDADGGWYADDDLSACRYHKDVRSATADLRKTIKRRIVARALDLREGSAFERGRALGRLERDAAWWAWDARRRTTEVWKDAKERWTRERDRDKERDQDKENDRKS